MCPELLNKEMLLLTRWAYMQANIEPIHTDSGLRDFAETSIPTSRVLSVSPAKKIAENVAKKIVQSIKFLIINRYSFIIIKKN